MVMIVKKFVIWIWKNNIKVSSWLIFLSFTGLVVSYTLAAMYTDTFSKKVFLSDDSTKGHYQIEDKCNLCHSAYNNVPQDNCVDCHAEELKQVNDSHSVKKFRDPRNADDLDKINVLKCVTCHGEHDPDATRKMGVTIASDFCIYCHEDVSEDRPTHKDLPFDGCSQCHNYHNNTALYEKFLIKHDFEDPVKSPARIEKANFGSIYKVKLKEVKPLKISDAKYPQDIVVNKSLMQTWQADGHAISGINCKQCHSDADSTSLSWVNKPTTKYCSQCHEKQERGFLASKHGMRLKQKMPAITPGKARSPMNIAEANKQMNCNACHGAHDFDSTFAAIDACVKCHDDTHSHNYKKSKHYKKLVMGRKLDDIKTSGVTCATCHLPRKVKQKNGLKYTYVEHNQNENLRPNQQMARNVCMNCHGLEFSLDALADEQLVTNNFNGNPNSSLGLMKMVRKNLQFNQSKKRSLK